MNGCCRIVSYKTCRTSLILKETLVFCCVAFFNPFPGNSPVTGEVNMNLVMTADGVYKLTQGIIQAELKAAADKGTYLQALVATTQKELGITPRDKTVLRKITDEKMKEQLEALRKVHDTFYDAVVRACSEEVPAELDKAKEVNRRSNFARTAMGAIRTWIKGGNDLTGLAAHRVTKASLSLEPDDEASDAELSPKSLARRAEAKVKQLLEHCTTLAEKDKDAAIEQLQKALVLIRAKLVEFGVDVSARALKSVAARVLGDNNDGDGAQA